ncbi:3-ketoacyl-ACP reductase [Salisediminibacterium halotolerans]|uniref:3-ketoacyl-ACP reductase n=1 Tax=Salisediminibacterium halotolerans TaxID=517425 RepID=UPI000EB2768C|nr:3-ketoacyl-ACP reductase [Salisediminibacterium halotolerans]RLJ73166.1 3-oxoacyl-[acyl-carrier protein] reductase [Actinophytocola xinjiangensis]RPE86588.1 3-oxoacyl-[acyl-carrier protein] reductase [Salisediminibacterium halotolerans]TWG33963.1 3-oxoacyl-[acyl-carrier protein] reductase [Salisediminibacterium halotolerans]GEL06629.1 putative oxidoreductase YoxD [Salisediminibacterium halotolerans]
MQSLQGKKVLITGGSRGIGRATALYLADEGAELALIASSENSFTDIKKELDERGAKYVTAAADISDEKAVEGAVGYIKQQLGSVDILINNAGVIAHGKFHETSADEFRRLLDVNVMGIVHVTQQVLPMMIEQNQGDIINIASMAGVKGSPGASAYSASKFAVIGLSESLMQEVRPHNIRVSTLTPSLVETEMTRGDERNPEKFTQAEDMAEFIVSQLKLEQRTFVKSAATWATNPF